MATKIVSWEGTTSNTAIREDGNSQTALAQRFTVGDSYDIEYVRFRTIRFNPCGNITIALYDRDNGDPDASLGSVVIDASGWSTVSSTVRTFTFDTPISITAGNYAVVLTDDTDYGVAIGEGTAGAGPGGAIKLVSGSWLEQGTPARTYYHEIWAADSAPSKPANPSPANDATEEDFSAFGLSWDDGGGADTYNVYIGTSGSLSLVSSAQAATSYTTEIGEVPTDQKIYWRVDATNAQGTTTGDVWNFDARPGKVSVFTPADEATGLTLDATTGSWDSPSANTSTYNTYYGTLSGFLSLVENTAALESTLTEYNFDQYGEIYYWRVDAVNEFGTTQGDELYFTTLVFVPPTPPGVTWTDPGNAAGYTGTPTGENAMIAVRRLVVAANNRIWYEGI